MDSEYSFDTLLMIGILKSLKEQGLITEYELKECVSRIESEDENVKSSGVLQSINR